MNDLEITRLCAEAMGLFNRHKDSALYGRYEGAEWRPLADDAQAMALVKKMKLTIIFNGENCTDFWSVGPEGMESSTFDADGDDLNRAICECVAKMKAVKG